MVVLARRKNACQRMGKQAAAQKSPTPAMAKYAARSQSWSLLFENRELAARAMLMLRRLDGRKPCVQRGSEPTLRDNSVSFVWNSEVAGKSMIEFLRAHEPEFFGPRGKVRIKSFEARAARSAIFNSAVGENAAASQPAPGVHSSGPDDGTYCPLPTTLASNSLDHSRWFDKAAVFE